MTSFCATRSLASTGDFRSKVPYQKNRGGVEARNQSQRAIKQDFDRAIEERATEQVIGRVMLERAMKQMSDRLTERTIEKLTSRKKRKYYHKNLYSKLVRLGLGLIH